MQTLQLSKPGFDHLDVVDVPTSPTAGAGEILVRVRAVSLNHRDLFAIDGRAAVLPTFPFVPGSDAAGEVVAVGTGVTRWCVGDRVMTTFVPGWHTGWPTSAQRGGTLGSPLPGVLQELVAVAEGDVVRSPEGWSHEEASTLAIAGLTAWAVLEDGGVKPGSVVLTQGTGGVALFALQFAKAAGATVISLSSSADKLAQLRALGADATIDYQAQPQWAAAVRSASGGRGVDIVVETTGSTLGQSVECCALGAFIGVVGFVGGFEAPVPVRRLIGGMLRIHGSFVGSRERFEQMVATLPATGVRPVIDRVFDLAQGRAAFEHLRDARHVGKVVIRLP